MRKILLLLLITGALFSVAWMLPAPSICLGHCARPSPTGVLQPRITAVKMLTPRASPPLIETDGPPAPGDRPTMIVVTPAATKSAPTCLYDWQTGCATPTFAAPPAEIPPTAYPILPPPPLPPATADQ